MFVTRLLACEVDAVMPEHYLLTLLDLINAEDNSSD